MRCVSIAFACLPLLLLGSCADRGNSLPIAQAERILNASLQAELAGSQPSLKILGTEIVGIRLIADVVAVNPLNAVVMYEGDPPNNKEPGNINPVYRLQMKTAADSNWRDCDVVWDCGTEIEQRRISARSAGSFKAVLSGFLDPDVKTMRVGLLLSWTGAEGTRHEEVCWSDPVTPASRVGVALELELPEPNQP